MIFFLGLFMQNVQGYSRHRSRRPHAGSDPGGDGLGHRVGPHRRPHRGPGAHHGRDDADGRGCILGFTQVQADTPYSSYWWMLTIMGIGTGLVMSPITTAVDEHGTGSARGDGFCHPQHPRQVGGVFGIAVLGAIVTGRFVSEIRAALNALDVPPLVTEKVVEIAREGRAAGGSGMPSDSRSRCERHPGSRPCLVHHGDASGTLVRRCGRVGGSRHWCHHDQRDGASRATRPPGGRG